MAVAIQEAEGRDDTDPKVRESLRVPLRLNWRLWTIFQAELTSEDNQLPADLSENMLTLCRFIDKHTVDTLVQPTPERLMVLIDLNRNIASGLLTTPEAAQEEAPEQAPSDLPPEDAPRISISEDV